MMAPRRRTMENRQLTIDNRTTSSGIGQLSACVECFDQLSIPSLVEGLRRDVVGFQFSLADKLEATG